MIIIMSTSFLGKGFIWSDIKLSSSGYIAGLNHLNKL